MSLSLARALPGIHRSCPVGAVGTCTLGSPGARHRCRLLTRRRPDDRALLRPRWTPRSASGLCLSLADVDPPRLLRSSTMSLASHASSATAWAATVLGIILRRCALFLLGLGCLMLFHCSARRCLWFPCSLSGRGPIDNLCRRKVVDPSCSHCRFPLGYRHSTAACQALDVQRVWRVMAVLKITRRAYQSLLLPSDMPSRDRVWGRRPSCAGEGTRRPCMRPPVQLVMVAMANLA